MSRNNGGEPLFIPKGEPKERVKVSARTLENVKMGQGSWNERRKKYHYFNDNIAQAAEFEPKETREAVDLRVINFDKAMTGEEVAVWLAGSPEYSDYELAAPEHLDALNGDPRLSQMAKERDEFIVALGASTIVKGERYVASLYAWQDGERWLNLIWWDCQWDTGYSFLLVRKAGT